MTDHALLTDVLPDQHHAEVHAIDGADHTIATLGAYVPAVSNAGTATFSVAQGEYVELGGLVWVNIRLVVGAVGAGGGAIGVSLPVAPDLTVVTALLNLLSTNAGNSGVGHGVINGSGSGAGLADRLFVLNSGALQRSQLSAGGLIQLSGCYRAA